MRKEFFVLGLIAFITGCDPSSPSVSDAGIFECSQGTVKCDEFCVDLNTDIYHCGSCGHNCAVDLQNASGICNGVGKCQIQKCNDGWADCDGRNAPFDPNTQWEPAGVIVQSGQDNGCETRILNPTNRCPNFACENPALHNCSGKCVAFDVDNENCGGCGIKCPDTHQCIATRCAIK